MTRPFTNPWIYIISAGTIFGVGGLVTKWLIEGGVHPLFLSGGLATFTALVALALHRRMPRPTPGTWQTGMVVGACNIGGPIVLFNLGFVHLPASINTLLISLGPVFTAVTAHFLSTDDRFTRVKMGGLGLSMVGVAFLAGAPQDDSGGRPLLGVALTLGGAVLQGASNLWVKRMSVRFSPATTLAPMTTGAALIAATVLLVVRPSVDVSAINGGQWLWLCVLGSTGVVAFRGVLRANQLAPATQAALSAYLVPLIGVVGGVLVLGEPFTLPLLIGGSLVIAGVVLTGRSNPVLVRTIDTRGAR
jgi:drug/metabolite transporter (DMT)-like permease